MAASTSPLDKFRQGASGISTTLQSSISNSDVTLTPASISNIPTVTAVDITVDRVDSSGAATPSKLERMIGVVSGGNLVSLLRGQDNTTAVPHSTGAVIEMIPTGKWSQDLVSGIMAHANPDGSLITSAVQSALGLTNLNGYTPVGYTPNTVTYNGNRSYDLVFNGQDLTSFLSNGMRLRTTRTVAAPTQCTSLNGTTQYYSKASPAGMTFTDDFVAGAWVKLSSYSAGLIIGRYDGTNGWLLFINGSGQVVLQGNNAGAGNYSTVTSYQSLPLNKWVHVSAQLDMSAFTATTTTSYVMLDGVDVPSFVARAGTSPTTLAQGTASLTVGAQSGGAGVFFPGKIAQAAVFSSKVTQATIRGYISQGLAGTETSLISAYSFNNTINDLNTTNANNLTASGSAVATNADSPFTGQAGGTTNGTTDYAEIVSATFSTNTTVTVRATDVSSIPTTGGVASVVYSSNVAPYGWPGGTSVANHIKLGVGFSTSSATDQQIPGAITTLTLPVGRSVRITAQAPFLFNNTGACRANLRLYDGLPASGKVLALTTGLPNNTFAAQGAFVETVLFVDTASKTLTASLSQDGGGTATIDLLGTALIQFKVELLL